MKLLFVSNLFPDASDPVRGLDNACLLHQLSRDHGAEVRAVAIRPQLPLRGRNYEMRAEDAGLAPVFCATSYIPKIGSRWNHQLMARALRKTLVEVRRDFDFDLILGSWLYPDGCAIAKLSESMGFPFWLICQGSDAHGYLEIPVRRKLIVEAARCSRGVITRSADLADRLAAAGVEKATLHPVYNGVDTRVFHPASDVRASRESLGLAADVEYLLFVGNFLPVKNPLLLIEAWRVARERMPESDLRLVMIGAGPLQEAIQQRAGEIGLADRLSMPGRLPPTAVADYMRAARCLVLSSRNEGVPNVVLEAFASGLPVVSTDVGGIDEVINADFLGKLVPDGDSASLAEAIVGTVQNVSDRQQIAMQGSQFSWEKTGDRYWDLLTSQTRGNQ